MEPYDQENQPGQVAAVCYRNGKEGLRLLLVRTFDGQWTFPKGNVDPEHSPSEAAEVEAWEEAGVHGRVEETPLTTYRYAKGNSDARGREISVAAYLLAVEETAPPPETWRHPEWFAPEAAKKALAEGRSARHAAELARVVDLAVKTLR